MLTSRPLSASCTVTGTVSGSAASMDGQVVTVSSSSKDKLNLSRVTGGRAPGDLDVAAGTVGGTALAANARIYDKVGGSAMTQITLDDIPGAAVKQGDIAYVHKNYAGDIDILVLEDVTGVGYTYGRIEVGENRETSSLGEIVNKTVTVHYADENGKHQSKGPYLCAAFKDGDWGGIVPGETSSAGTRLSAYVVLMPVSALIF